MKIYWSYRSVPDLQNLPKKEAKAIWKACSQKAFKDNKKVFWKSIGVFAVFLVIAVFTQGHYWLHLHEWMKSSWFPATIASPFHILAMRHFWTEASLPLIRQALAQRQVTAN